MRKEWVEGASKGERNAMDKVVRRYGGLLVALTVAGKGIRSTARGRGWDDEEEKEGRLAAILRCIGKVERLRHAQMDLGKREHGVHVGLYESLEVCLEIASKTDKEEDRERECCFERLYRGLSVPQKKVWAPVTMLSCL